MKYDKFKLLVIIKNKSITKKEILDNLEEIKLLEQLKWNERKFLFKTIDITVKTRPRSDLIELIDSSNNSMTISKEQPLSRFFRLMEIKGLI